MTEEQFNDLPLSLIFAKLYWDSTTYQDREDDLQDYELSVKKKKIAPITNEVVQHTEFQRVLDFPILDDEAKLIYWYYVWFNSTIYSIEAKRRKKHDSSSS